MDATISQEDYEYIMRNESGHDDPDKAYQAVKRPHHPGNPGSNAYNNSGVTISYGVDLGNRKPAEVRKMLTGVLPADRVQKMVEASGLKGDQARKFVKENNVEMSAVECKQIHQK